MPVPPLTPKGLLPEGIHECTLAECIVFAQLPPQPGRMELWRKFENWVGAIQPLGVALSIYLDGGFVTNNGRANDIDLVLEIPVPSPALAQMMRRPEFDQEYVKNNYSLEFFHWWAGHPAPPNDFRSFFQYINPKDAPKFGLQAKDRKGILHVRL